MTTAMQMVNNTKQRAKVWESVCDKIAVRARVPREYVGGYIMCSAYKANGIGSDSLLYATQMTELELCNIVLELHIQTIMQG